MTELEKEIQDVRRKLNLAEKALECVGKEEICQHCKHNDICFTDSKECKRFEWRYREWLL